MCRVIAIVLLACQGIGFAWSQECEARAFTESGPVCGRVRTDARGSPYASFRGVPYAGQPVGSRRFKPLQPAEPWPMLYALEEGPVCPQTDVLYGPLQNLTNQSEACIFANIHVPLQPRRFAPNGHPILVFIHGGGFAFGSGNADLHGPEYLVAEGVIVITFNYRLNVFGFLSLGTAEVPGNQGLRDAVTLLQWVQRNANAFGGDASRVTLAGQSAGAAAAHILALSPAANTLFHRVIIMSGTALPSFYTMSPAYARFVASQLLTSLGINTTDPVEAHRQLVATPLEAIMTVNAVLQDAFGIVVFLPVLETHDGYSNLKIIDMDTELALKNGRDSHLPFIVGFTDAEGETFRPRFKKVDVLDKIKENPLLLLWTQWAFTLPMNESIARAMTMSNHYFGGGPIYMDAYVRSATDTYYVYPALRTARYRLQDAAAPLFLYEFAYSPEHSAIAQALEIQYRGAAHIEDLTFVFRTNSLRLPPSPRDDAVRLLMVQYFANFVHHGAPSPPSSQHPWPPLDLRGLRINVIDSEQPTVVRPTKEHCEILQLFDNLHPGVPPHTPSHNFAV